MTERSMNEHEIFQQAGKLGRYGRKRLSYLREHQPVTLDELLRSGELNAHLQEVEDAVRSQIEQSMEALKKQIVLPDQRTDPLGWARTMNALHAQAEELALPLLYE